MRGGRGKNAVTLLIITSCMWTLSVREYRDKIASTFSYWTYPLRNILLDEHRKRCRVSYMDSVHQEGERKKVILYYGELEPAMSRLLQFDGCEHSNCILQYCTDLDYALRADALVFAHNSLHVSMALPAHTRQRQLRFVHSFDSPAKSHDHFNKAVNYYNGTMSYTHTASLYIPFGMTLPVSSINKLVKTINCAQGKTKGAYAYVSNCHSLGYHRLQAMKQLSNYIDIDIFGSCTGNRPCPNRLDLACESRVHSQYRFYLAFENSLCTEYITERFWKTLESDGHFIPVALGGLSLSEYTNLAPPDSFIHVYNFSSIAHLGLHLQRLMTDDTAYNRYHQWREKYIVTRNVSKQTVCNFCKMINHPQMLGSTRHRQFADEWNDPSNCRKFYFN